MSSTVDELLLTLVLVIASSPQGTRNWTDHSFRYKAKDILFSFEIRSQQSYVT